MTKISQENLRSILAAIHNFSLSSDFGIQHLEKQGQPVWGRKQNKTKTKWEEEEEKNRQQRQGEKKTNTATQAIKHLPK